MLCFFLLLAFLKKKGLPGRLRCKESACEAGDLPAVKQKGLRSLGREDPLEEEMETHCSILAWRIPETEEPGGLQSMGSQKSET